MLPTTSFLTVLATTTTFIRHATAHGGHDESPPRNSTSGSPYTLKTDMSYQSFFSAFDFFSGPDPTNGFVQYQPLEKATSQQLIGYLADTQSVYMGVDHTTKDPRGRASVRLESKAVFNKGLLAIDVRHMPDSLCGSWPAFWMVGTQNGEVKWPDAGEIDILEGVNDETRNAVTLHTSAGCAVENNTAPVAGADGVVAAPFLGTMATSNCDVAAKGQDKNVGCSIKAPEPRAKGSVPTYGTEFNKAGGGVYAMEWTDEAISVWFFPRDSEGIAAFSPAGGNTNSTGSNSSSLAAPASLDPSTFGTPQAKFAGSGCDFTQRFQDLKIVFDTTFCGEWAGKVWDESCAAKTGVATCEEYVRENPEVFADAYWEVAGLWWFEKAAGAGVKRTVQPRQNVKSFGREMRW